MNEPIWNFSGPMPTIIEPRNVINPYMPEPYIKPFEPFKPADYNRFDPIAPKPYYTPPEPFIPADCRVYNDNLSQVGRSPIIDPYPFWKKGPFD